MDCSSPLYTSIGFALFVCVIFSLSALVLVEHSRPPLHPQRTAGSHAVNLHGDSVGDASQQQDHPSRMSSRQLLEEVAKHHPLNRLQCGHWMDDYTNLHKAILAGKAPQKYTVMRSKQEFGNGLADRLATSVTIFMYALLTDRAFQYDWDPPPEGQQEKLQQQEFGKYMYFEPPTHLWAGLRSEFIDWRYTSPDKGQPTVVMDYNCDKETDIYKDYFAKQDLTQLHTDVHTVIWHADHAMVYKAFDNPHIAGKLESMGLQRETAFACMFDYLYRPTQPVLDVIRQELNVLLEPNTLKLGIQIRVGDWQLCDTYTFKPQSYPSLFDHYFDCAKEIEQELAQPGQKVVWYTLADIPALRSGLATRHTSRILINTHVVVEHIVKSRNASQQGFFEAVGELWAFSLTSAHVVTRKSGFGKVPAMINANGTQHIHVVDYPMRWGWFGLDNRKNIGWFRRQPCIAKNAAPLSFLCTDFTGI